MTGTDEDLLDDGTGIMTQNDHFFVRILSHLPLRKGDGA